MGTRSMTKIHDHMWKEKPAPVVVAMYRQFDGYPDGHGLTLAEFLNDLTIVNGLQHDGPTKVANGAGCLAAQMVARFKTDPGGIYLYATDCDGEEYSYDVSVHGPGEPITMEVTDYSGATVFSGTTSQYLAQYGAKSATP